MRQMTDVYVWVAENPPPLDCEGILGAKIGAAGWFSFTAEDRDRALKLAPHARAAARASGQKVRLLHFTAVEEVPVP